MDQRKIDGSFNALDLKPFQHIRDDQKLLPRGVTVCPIIIAINATSDTATFGITLELGRREIDRHEFDDCLTITNLPTWSTTTDVIFEILRVSSSKRFKKALIEHILAEDGIVELHTDNEAIEVIVTIGSQEFLMQIPAEEFMRTLPKSTNPPNATGKHLTQ